MIKRHEGLYPELYDTACWLSQSNKQDLGIDVYSNKSHIGVSAPLFHHEELSETNGCDWHTVVSLSHLYCHLEDRKQEEWSLIGRRRCSFYPVCFVYPSSLKKQNDSCRIRSLFFGPYFRDSRVSFSCSIPWLHIHSFLSCIPRSLWQDGERISQSLVRYEFSFLSSSFGWCP